MSEVPALLYAPLEEISRRRMASVGRVLEEGSALVERESIPKTAMLRTWGTPCYLRELSGRGLVSLGALGQRL